MTVSTPNLSSPLVPIVAIAAGVLCFAGAVALELAGHAVPAELWVAGTGALTGGLGMAVPTSSSAAPSSTASEIAAAVGELAALAGAVPPATAGSFPGTSSSPAATAASVRTAP